jgi:hypothetical protein
MHQFRFLSRVLMAPAGDAGGGGGAAPDGANGSNPGGAATPAGGTSSVDAAAFAKMEERLAASEKLTKELIAQRDELKRKQRGEGGSQKSEKQEPTPADAIAELQRFRKETALKDAILDAGLKLSATQRKLLQAQFLAESPEDVGEWLRGYADAFPTPAAAPATPPKVERPDLGAPGRTPAAELPTDPSTWTPEQIRSLPRGEAKRRVQEARQQAGKNPYFKPLPVARK